MRKYSVLEMLVTVTAIWVLTASAVILPDRAFGSPARNSAGTIPREVWVALRSTNQALAPVDTAQASSSHAPYLMGECKVCHRSNNISRPGPVSRKPQTLCLDCHDQADEVDAHDGSAATACTSCHNPHNARDKALLLP